MPSASCRRHPAAAGRRPVLGLTSRLNAAAAPRARLKGWQRGGSPRPAPRGRRAPRPARISMQQRQLSPAPSAPVFLQDRRRRRRSCAAPLAAGSPPPRLAPARRAVTSCRAAQPAANARPHSVRGRSRPRKPSRRPSGSPGRRPPSSRLRQTRNLMPTARLPWTSCRGPAPVLNPSDRGSARRPAICPPGPWMPRGEEREGKGARPVLRQACRQTRACGSRPSWRQPPITAQAHARRLLPPLRGFFPFFAGFHGQFPIASALFTKNPSMDAPKFRGRFIGMPCVCPAWRKRIMTVWETCGP